MTFDSEEQRRLVLHLIVECRDLRLTADMVLLKKAVERAPIDPPWVPEHPSNHLNDLESRANEHA